MFFPSLAIIGILPFKLLWLLSGLSCHRKERQRKTLYNNLYIVLVCFVMACRINFICAAFKKGCKSLKLNFKRQQKTLHLPHSPSDLTLLDQKVFSRFVQPYDQVKPDKSAFSPLHQGFLVTAQHPEMYSSLKIRFFSLLFEQ